MEQEFTSFRFNLLVVFVAASLLVPNGWAPIPMVGGSVFARTTMDDYPKPNHVVQPTYPIGMLKSGTVGMVDLEFVINEQGKVEKPVIRYAFPAGELELTALQAIRQLKYDPESIKIYERKIISVDPLQVKGIWSYSFISKMDTQSDIVVPQPKFPETAVAKGSNDGIVIVEFQWKRTEEISQLAVASDYAGQYVNDINGVYAPVNPSVVYADPKGVFEESALQALANARYDFFVPWAWSSPPTLPPNEDDAVAKVHRFEFSLNSEPKTRTNPSYPDEAIQNKVEGNVVVKFDISIEGKVLNPTVIHSDAPGIFDAAAIDNVSQFTFDTRDEVSTDILHLVAFQLDSEIELLSTSGLEVVAPGLLQDVSLSEILNWYIDLQFDVNESGVVEHTEVLESNAPIKQQLFAVGHARKAIFKPQIVDGKPVRVSNVKYRYVVTPTEINTTEMISELHALNGSIQKPLYYVSADANGEVIVEFDVDKHGVVNNPRIVDSNLKDYYADLSLAMVNNFRYDPLFVDGKSVAVPNVRHSFWYSQSTKNDDSYRVHLDDGKPRLGIKAEK